MRGGRRGRNLFLRAALPKMTVTLERETRSDFSLDATVSMVTNWLESKSFLQPPVG